MLELTSMASGSGMKVALLLDGLPFPPTDSYGGAFGDDCHVTRILRTSFLVVDHCNPAVFYGKSGNHNRSYSVLSNPGLPPRQKEYSYSADLEKYSNPIGAAFDVVFTDNSIPTRENQVVHTSAEGRVIPGVEDLYTYNMSLEFSRHGFSWPKPDQTYGDIYQLVYFATDYASSFPGSNLIPGYYWPSYSVELNQLLEQLKSIQEYDSPYPYIGYEYWGPLGSGEKVFGQIAPNGNWFANNKLTITPNGYKMSNYLFSSSLGRLTESETILTPRLLQDAPSVNSGYGNNVYVVDVTQSSKVSIFEYSAFINDGQRWPHWESVSGWQERPYRSSTTLSALNTAYSRPYKNSISVPDLLKYGRSKSLQAIEAPMAQRLRDIRPSSLNSFSDALSHYRLMTSNYIEIMFEAKELLSLAPDIAELLRLFWSRDPKDLGYLIKKGSKYHIRALVKNADKARGLLLDESLLKVGDFFASTYLLKTFGWRPLQQNAAEITSKIDNIGMALRMVQSPSTQHGKFTFSDFSWLGHDHLHLTTRSKVRFGGVSNDFVIKTLQLDTLGILPGLSNVWDLIPYSWFIDYFTALSTRYDILDSIFLGHMMNVLYCTHSFTIDGNVPKAVLKANNLTSSTGASPKFTVYFREFSRVVPSILYENVLDFSGPKYAPDKGVLASLLWILLRR